MTESSLVQSCLESHHHPCSLPPKAKGCFHSLMTSVSFDCYISIKPYRYLQDIQTCLFSSFALWITYSSTMTLAIALISWNLRIILILIDHHLFLSTTRGMLLSWWLISWDTSSSIWRLLLICMKLTSHSSTDTTPVYAILWALSIPELFISICPDEASDIKTSELLFWLMLDSENPRNPYETKDSCEGS